MIFKNQTYKDIRSCNIGHYPNFITLLFERDTIARNFETQITLITQINSCCENQCDL